MIERPHFLKQLEKKRGNGLVKIVTGIRRCGKSYLLFEIFRDHLRALGVPEDHIIALSLDELSALRYRNPMELDAYVRSRITNSGAMHYVLLDEIQKVKTIPNPYLEDSSERIGFVDVLLGLRTLKNVDVYVTGSNSKMLSTEVATEFRGKGDEIALHPLSYQEFCSGFEGPPQEAWPLYMTYGGLPYVTELSSHRDKAHYLVSLFETIYVDDILERHRLKDKSVFDNLLDVISSSIGSLSNPKRISDTFASKQNLSVHPETIGQYLDYCEEALLIRKAHRFDVKGRKYIGSPLKYYYTDVGLRNARLNFRQLEETHIMENILYNELIRRGYSVDVGVVEHAYCESDGKRKKTNLEIDFVANRGSSRIYVQSALSVGDEAKHRQEIRPYQKLHDSFSKRVVVRDPIVPHYDDAGIYYEGIEHFLRNETTEE